MIRLITKIKPNFLIHKSIKMIIKILRGLLKAHLKLKELDRW